MSTTTTTTTRHANITIFGFPLSIFPYTVQYIFVCSGFLITFSIQTLLSTIEYSNEDISTINLFQNLFITIFAFVLKVLRPNVNRSCPILLYFILSFWYSVESICTLYLQTNLSFKGLLFTKLFSFLFLKFDVYKKSLIYKILSISALILISFLILYFFTNNSTILSLILHGISSIIFIKILSEIEVRYSPEISEIIIYNFSISLLLSLPVFIIQTNYVNTLFTFQFHQILIAYSNSNILFVKTSFLLTALKIFGLNSIINFILFEFILLLIIKENTYPPIIGVCIKKPRYFLPIVFLCYKKHHR